MRFGWAPLRSVRADGVKFIEAPRPEFYNLRTDAAELDNRYEPWNSQVQKFRGMLAERAGEDASIRAFQRRGRAGNDRRTEGAGLSRQGGCGERNKCS